MGLGDELMAVACAKKESDRLGGGKIYILDRHDRARSHTLFEHYDFIARLEDQYGVVGRVRNGPGVRPYIDYEATAPGRESPWRYTQWSVNSVGPAPDVWPSMPMKDGPNILLHPHKKPGASPNKMWGWERWQRLADLLADACTLYQVGPDGTRKLAGAHLIITPTFFDAIPALKAMDLAVLPEGGLHHAAASVGTLAVVLFGHMLDPLNTGYDMHRNITANDSPCGERVPCGKCAEWWSELKPETVAIEIEQCLKQS
ncbi:MAG: hypothetical protein IID54_01680 [Proteobacteria bacterium]|nr:hypothetical protein [Pseudomonadota bacterium]